MPYRRRILRYGPDPDHWDGALDERAVAGCSFELLRLGGCGSGEVQLRDGFVDRGACAVGRWIACEFDDGDRWYLGRIERRSAASPAGVTLQLEGMGVQLGEVYPGGFGADADGRPPHRYARTDRFPGDPDHDRETVDVVERPEDVVRLLLQQYVVPQSDIKAVSSLIEDAPVAAELVSLKFNGEESVRSILKDLALRVRNGSWGVDELGRFFFLQPRNEIVATFQQGVDLTVLRETQNREALFNRVLLTGGYVYGSPMVDSAVSAAVRWRGNYLQPASISQFGERRIRLWTPWIRTVEDSRQFVREFFRTYATPPIEYDIEVVQRGSCPRPWLGAVRLLDRTGTELAVGQPASIRVQFDATPRLRLHIGPDDPRTHWPEPPHDERFPVSRRPDDPGGSGGGGGGGPVTLTQGPGTSGGPGTDDSSSSDDSALTSSSLASSDWTSSALDSSGLSTSESGGGSPSDWFSSGVDETSDSDASAVTSMQTSQSLTSDAATSTATATSMLSSDESWPSSGAGTEVGSLTSDDSASPLSSAGATSDGVSTTDSASTSATTSGADGTTSGTGGGGSSPDGGSVTSGPASGTTWTSGSAETSWTSGASHSGTPVSQSTGGGSSGGSLPSGSPGGGSGHAGTSHPATSTSFPATSSWLGPST